MKTNFIIIAGLLTFIMACQHTEPQKRLGPSPKVEWSRNATIYEVNIRQFTPEGTFKAFEKELPRLQKMGIGILWLMPVNPIGVKNRKGTLGSYYAVKDYYGINPEFGSEKDFKNLVNRIHSLGMKVIIDWVANHTSWDNVLIDKHPEWYTKDSTDKIIAPVADWTDVADLDYTKQGLRDYMKEVMCFWLREYDIDGFRCDVAGMIPVDFWNETVPALRQIKPIFMLAEEEQPDMHDTAFDATYSWQMYRAMNDIAKGKTTAKKIDSLLAADQKNYPADAYRMRFTSNHDENTWTGTEFERLGSGARTFAVLTFTLPGIPLIYSGQEAANAKRLRFFDKDTIQWGSFTLEEFYSSLIALKKSSDLIASGDSGGAFIKVPTTNDRQVYCFIRKKAEHRLLVLLNFSDTDQSIQLKGKDFQGLYKSYPSGSEIKLKDGERMTLVPWQYLVYESVP